MVLIEKEIVDFNKKGLKVLNTEGLRYIKENYDGLRKVLKL